MPSGPLPWTLAQFETYLQAARDPALRAAAADALAVYEDVGATALAGAGAPDAGSAAQATVDLQPRQGHE